MSTFLRQHEAATSGAAVPPAAVQAAEELRGWIRDLLAAFASQPDPACDALIAGLTFGAREELAGYGIIADADARAAEDRAFLTPFGTQVAVACAEYVRENGESPEYQEKVAAASRLADQSSATSARTAPHARRRAERKR